MKTYYITDSTIFSKAEEIVAALKNGMTVMNDDTKLRFIIKTKYRKPVLMVQDFFADKNDWDTITPRNWSVAGIVEAMDAVVDLNMPFNPAPKWNECYNEMLNL